ncbi:MAG: hypothetical protein JJT96_18690 [Opitutales bacterium]|nr:hypothetical protein [Opitutales bacterium]
MPQSVLEKTTATATISSAPRCSRDQIIQRDDDRFVVIDDFDQLPPFFCSLTSDADLWVFISSTGSLTAGRRDPEEAILPYETVDKIHDNGTHTGPVALLRWRGANGSWRIWEPFRSESVGSVSRRLMKNVAGTRMIFEETLPEEKLCFCSTIMISPRFGLVREIRVHNLGERNRQVEVFHGMRNLVACGATRQLQNEMSCLLDAYKQSEILEPAGVGLYSMASGVTDHPVPFEVLRATVAWSCGLSEARRSLQPSALEAFRTGGTPTPCAESRGVRGHFFEWATIDVAAGEDTRWNLITDTSLHQGAVTAITQLISEGLPVRDVEEDIAFGESSLRQRLAAADALQETGDPVATAHHLANVLFNVMRGGTFPGGYTLLRDDFRAFLESANKRVARAHREKLGSLPQKIDRQALLEAVQATGDTQLERLFFEYLPLSFSRRHGDPSRPWNRFRIETRDEQGNDILTFQGNWRDIFQNWEALALSFPGFLESMICKFVNASTADGYNPYRITRNGIDWEEPEPENPWAAFGYWGDHQIIYLLKLLETHAAHHAGGIDSLLDKKRFTYANVPYRLKSFSEILRDPRNTLVCDTEMAATLRKRAAGDGSDAKLVCNEKGEPILVTFLEKLLVPVLAKWSNFVPGGGIWMNTQRPEWNDANNALVGNGLSMVTLYYLRRHQAFLRDLLTGTEKTAFDLSAPVVRFLQDLHESLRESRQTGDAHTPAGRRRLLQRLGEAGERHRAAVYGPNFPANTVPLNSAEIIAFLEELLLWTDETIHLNRREDGLFHAYNLLVLQGQSAEIRYLDPMLEGQVSALSSGLLSPHEAIDLLDSLRHSSLYCEKRRSYILYPDRPITPFLQKNRLDPAAARKSPLLSAMFEKGDRRIVYASDEKTWRFHPDFHNEGDLVAALGKIISEGSYGAIAEAEIVRIRNLYETVFQHHSFTGRSGSMFAFEGLGSIYWHMISKLLLAVQEILVKARADGVETALCEKLDRHYEAILDGLGFRKSAREYGAFPTDPYSHTPAHAGAQQPGMTGQVKEEILTRRVELGVHVKNGCIHFTPTHALLDTEFLAEDGEFRFINTTGREDLVPLKSGSLAFTLCQTPIVYHRKEANAPAAIRIQTRKGEQKDLTGHTLDAKWSESLFTRSGNVRLIEVDIPLSPRVGRE